MQKFRLIVIGMIAGIILIAVFLWIGAFSQALAQPGQPPAASTPVPPSREANTFGLRFSVTGSDEIPPDKLPQSVQSPDALPTQIPGETLVYFAKTDSDATGTVLFLLNTDSVAHIVALRGFDIGTVSYCSSFYSCVCCRPAPGH